MKTKLGRPKKNILTSIKLPKSFRLKLFHYLVDLNEKVEVEGLGIFEIVDIPEKKTFHNFSQTFKVVKGYKKLKFTQSGDMKIALTDLLT